jgi:predicted XRE-type DNA-binding protein
MKKTDAEEAVHMGSGNVFADIGLPNPEERLLKARLMYAIDQEIKRQNLTQAKAAKIVGLAQPDLSRILNGRASNYSIDRLMRVLALLDQKIEIILTSAHAPIDTPPDRIIIGKQTMTRIGASTKRKASADKAITKR